MQGIIIASPEEIAYRYRRKYIKIDGEN